MCPLDPQGPLTHLYTIDNIEEPLQVYFCQKLNIYFNLNNKFTFSESCFN